MTEKDILQSSAEQEQVPLDTPFFRAYRGVYLERRSIAPHYHNELEILFPQGLAGETWVSGKRHSFQKRSAHIIPPGAVHSFRVWPQGDGSIFVIQLNTERCAALLNVFPNFNRKHFFDRLSRLPVSIDSLRKDMLSATLGLSPFRPKKSPAIESAVSDLEITSRILRILLESNRHKPAKPAIDERLYRILAALETDLDKPFDLDRISEATSLSRFHLCRLFKKTTGMTLTEYQTHARVRRAAYRLSERGLNVTQAAYETGFKSVSYFIKAFRKTMGSTPKQWVLSRITTRL
ncbi:MAG: hypothetical protein A2293_04180 [Elusimicrobia bacterium RIFOXYB2_FULL_49_7]|nr:MAG: hypothetical protein A2293_04180 [Elusimicrobia bacterium RIFOXYB2_FULL_49_7]